MDSILNYAEELTKAMTMLAGYPKTLFVGQAVRYDGQRAHATFSGVPMEKRIEMPVCEDFQMGFCAGLALEGYIPICFFPRFDFLIIAANQLINHLDKIPVLGDFRPKVIIRTAVGARAPLDPGPQHTQDYTIPMSMMLKNTDLFQLTSAERIVSHYQWVLQSERSAIMIEYMDKY